MTTDLQTPDADDVCGAADDACGAWRKASSVIGGPTHTHICRRTLEHRDTQDVEQIYPHRCECGHAW